MNKPEPKGRTTWERRTSALPRTGRAEAGVRPAGLETRIGAPGVLHLPLPLDRLYYKFVQGGEGRRPVGVRPSPPVAAMATILDVPRVLYVRRCTVARVLCTHAPPQWLPRRGALDHRQPKHRAYQACKDLSLIVHRYTYTPRGTVQTEMSDRSIPPKGRSETRNPVA